MVRRSRIDRPLQWGIIALPFSGSAYYLFGDGPVDQVGGDKRRAFGKKRIIALLEERLGRPLAEQRDAITAAFNAYQRDEIRRDDVAMVGFVPFD